jgi:DNA-binding transcriptional LysR family regulator
MTRDWPNMAALQLLLAIDDYGSLGAAARFVGSSQPHATRTLRQLERHLGIPLVERSPSGSRLSVQGTIIAHWARRIVTDATTMLDIAHGLRTQRAAELTTAASMTVAEHLMPRWLGLFRTANPAVTVHLQVCNSMEVMDGTERGTCDVGFIESPTVRKGLHSAVVAHDRLVVVVDRQHAWARRRRELTVEQLAATPLIVREPGSGTRTTLDVALADYDRAEPLLELGSSAAIRTSVLAGVGPSVLSTLSVVDELKSGRLHQVSVRNLELHRKLRAVWKSPRTLDGPAAALVKLARQDMASEVT